MNAFEIKKGGEDHEGPIVAVMIAGEEAGRVGKWKGLFVADGGMPHRRRQDAVREIVESWSFETDEEI